MITRRIRFVRHVSVRDVTRSRHIKWFCTTPNNFLSRNWGSEYAGWLICLIHKMSWIGWTDFLVWDDLGRRVVRRDMFLLSKAKKVSNFVLRVENDQWTKYKIQNLKKKVVITPRITLSKWKMQTPIENYYQMLSSNLGFKTKSMNYALFQGPILRRSLEWEMKGFWTKAKLCYDFDHRGRNSPTTLLVEGIQSPGLGQRPAFPIEQTQSAFVPLGTCGH